MTFWQETVGGRNRLVYLSHRVIEDGLLAGGCWGQGPVSACTDINLLNIRIKDGHCREFVWRPGLCTIRIENVSVRRLFESAGLVLEAKHR